MAEPEVLPVVDFIKEEALEKKNKRAKKRKVTKLSQIPVGDPSLRTRSNTNPYVQNDDIETLEEGDAPSSGGGHTQSFKSAISQLLAKADPESDGIFTEIETTESTEDGDEDALMKRKERRMLYAQRRLLKNKDHYIPETVFSEKETILRKTATRGVVKLFNAIRKHQKGEDSAPLVEKLKQPSGPLKETLESKKVKEDVKKPSWDVLRNDYLMDTKTKNFWNENEAEFEDDNYEYEDMSD